jgi:beta-lactam-binding protein with PASTA domain
MPTIFPTPALMPNVVDQDSGAAEAMLNAIGIFNITYADSAYSTQYARDRVMLQDPAADESVDPESVAVTLTVSLGVVVSRFTPSITPRRMRRRPYL